MGKQLTVTGTMGAGALVPADADKHAKYRLGRFAAWLHETGRPWHDPDLAEYRDHLSAGYSPATVAAHLSTVRGRYRDIMSSNTTRDVLFAMARQEAPGAGAADLKARVDELLARLGNVLDPSAAPVKQVKHQDTADAAHIRLTARQANALLARPGVDTLRGLRDTAILSVMLCTGVREAELVALDVCDLRQRMGGELALHVRAGKGSKARLIPWGELSWALIVVDRWLQAAGIEGGAVFRGFYKDNRTVRPGRLSVRAVQYVVAGYPVSIDGELVRVKPHDLRRTYARRLRDAGVALDALRLNLGHADLKTTLRYVGELDAEQRRAPAVYSFDLSKLGEATLC